jgi:hypothetical protein
MAGKKKMELGENVTRNDILNFVEHTKYKALEALREEQKTEKLNKQRELFGNKELYTILIQISNMCSDIKERLSILNNNLKETNEKNKCKYYDNLKILYADDHSLDGLELLYFNRFSHKEITELNVLYSKKQNETKIAYHEILNNLKKMRSIKKMSEYLLSIGFDITKIQAKDTSVKKPEPKTIFSKKTLFPCLK